MNSGFLKILYLTENAECRLLNSPGGPVRNCDFYISTALELMDCYMHIYYKHSAPLLTCGHKDLYMWVNLLTWKNIALSLSPTYLVSSQRHQPDANRLSFGILWCILQLPHVLYDLVHDSLRRQYVSLKVFCVENRVGIIKCPSTSASYFPQLRASELNGICCKLDWKACYGHPTLPLDPKGQNQCFSTFGKTRQIAPPGYQPTNEQKGSTK